MTPVKNVIAPRQKVELLQQEANFLEIKDKDHANMINLEVYRFIAFSENRGYIFKKRAKMK